MTEALSGARLLTRYKRWADAVTFGHILALPQDELLRERPTRYRNILHTLGHIHVIDNIFRAHLEGRPQGYAARNRTEPLPLDALWPAVQEMDDWYVGYADQLGVTEKREVVNFTFVDGGRGAMTREEVLLHVVNHGSYHRGFVGDMLYQVPAPFPANDLTVFLHEVRGR